MFNNHILLLVLGLPGGGLCTLEKLLLALHLMDGETQRHSPTPGLG